METRWLVLIFGPGKLGVLTLCSLIGLALTAITSHHAGPEKKKTPKKNWLAVSPADVGGREVQRDTASVHTRYNTVSLLRTWHGKIDPRSQDQGPVERSGFLSPSHGEGEAARSSGRRPEAAVPTTAKSRGDAYPVPATRMDVGFFRQLPKGDKTLAGAAWCSMKHQVMTAASGSIGVPAHRKHR